jgi:DNA-binding response OmpR family regulator
MMQDTHDLDARPRILVVEDNETLAFGLKSNLEFEGWNVQIAADGSDALAAATAFDPDLILLDLALPGIDGMELLRLWRTNDRITRIVVLSAKAAEVDRVAGLRAGADDYITLS